VGIVLTNACCFTGVLKLMEMRREIERNCLYTIFLITTKFMPDMNKRNLIVQKNGKKMER
jgi:hypothetical protein